MKRMSSKVASISSLSAALPVPISGLKFAPLTVRTPTMLSAESQRQWMWCVSDVDSSAVCVGGRNNVLREGRPGKTNQELRERVFVSQG